MTEPTLSTLLNFALDAVYQTGRLTLGHYQTQVDQERKADNTPVTVADGQAEAKLRELIGRLLANTMASSARSLANKSRPRQRVYLDYRPH
ncbi:MAG: hypothetical protein M5U34_39200 [Chloroflexi bacterium]|nr:hypothetical protein [Chloroflexota bacterium]